MNTQQKLDQLAELQAQVEYIRLQKQVKIDAVLTPEIQAQLASIEAEFEQRVEEIAVAEDALTAEIKADVINGGATIKGANLQAVYTKGRVSWDSKVLEGLAIAIPQVLQAKKEGAPSVSIRKVG